MDYGTSPNELDKKKREMKMRRKREKERGQKTVYSAFGLLNARVGFN